MADLALLKTQLAESEAALHRLMVGKMSVTIRVNGRLVEKTPADKNSLKVYISDLKAAISRAEGGSSSRSPISFHA
ncbi:MAG: hypothetical protein JKY93_02420 [Gammaproteobacteria bacterium]|nr:hypothetical protein [Gammaproteobacteria bacterium]